MNVLNLTRASLVLLVSLCVGCASEQRSWDPRARTRLELVTLVFPASAHDVLTGLGSPAQHEPPYACRVLTPAEVETVLGVCATPPGPLSKDTSDAFDTWPRSNTSLVSAELASGVDLGGEEPYSLGSAAAAFLGARVSQARVELRVDAGTSVSVRQRGEPGEGAPFHVRLEDQSLLYEGPRPAPRGGVVFFASLGAGAPVHGVLFTVVAD